MTAKPPQGFFTESHNQTKPSVPNQTSLARIEEIPSTVVRHSPAASQKEEAPRDASPVPAAPSPVLEPPAAEPEPEVEIDESVYDAAILDEVAALNDVFISLHSEFSCENSEVSYFEVLEATSHAMTSLF